MTSLFVRPSSPSSGAGERCWARTRSRPGSMRVMAAESPGRSTPRHQLAPPANRASPDEVPLVSANYAETAVAPAATCPVLAAGDPGAGDPGARDPGAGDPGPQRFPYETHRQ